MNLSSNQTDTKTDTRFFIVRGILLISVLLIFLVVLTLWGEAIDIDRRFSAQFFTTGEDWFLADSFPWNWLYDFGEAPGILFSILCFTCWIFFRTDPARAALRPYLLICALTPFIASLLMVNVVLKDHTGRPRPREITEFKGTWEYKPVLKAGLPGRGHSFPCGHCSIAFTLTSGFVFWQRSRKFALCSLSVGLAYGMLMSIARIAQGGHFLSDALWSLGVVSFTLLTLYYFVFQPPRTENNPVSAFSKSKKWKIFGGTAIILILLSLFVWTRRPFYKDHNGSFNISSDIKQVNLHLPKNWKLEQPVFEPRDNGKFQLIIQGFAPPHTTHYLSFTTETAESTMAMKFKENIVGYHREFEKNLDLRLPEKLKVNINLIPEKNLKTTLP